jgi:AraC family transcriptional regulator
VSVISQIMPIQEISAVGGLRELATNVIWLLQTAAKEVENDHKAAAVFIARASSLLQAETGRGVDPDWDVRPGGLALWQIDRVKAFVEEHLSEPIRVEDLSDAVRLSKTHFSRAFKRSYGETPHEYVVRRRVEQVCHLMLTSDLALSEVALACGFSDQAHLCKRFREITGKSPAAWRREQRLATLPDGCVQCLASEDQTIAAHVLHDRNMTASL